MTLEYQNYSVPYSYARKQVDVRLTSTAVEVYHKGQRIASHVRLFGRRGQYSTSVSHMPPNHQFYSEWNGERFLAWAKKIGSGTLAVVDKQLNSYVIEEQGYKCLALLKLADRYGKEKLESACNIALRQVPLPRYKLIAGLLSSGKVEQQAPTTREQEPHKEVISHAFVRGAAYYGGEHHDK